MRAEVIVLFGSLAASAIYFAWEWYKNRDQRAEYTYMNRNQGSRYHDEEDDIIINETRPKATASNVDRVRVPAPEDQCTICLESLINGCENVKYSIMALPICRHWFHRKCALRLLEYHPSCPVCRIPIDADSLLREPVRIPEEIPEDQAGNQDRNGDWSLVTRSQKPRQRNRHS